MEGLISAARPVAFATNLLIVVIETADGVLPGTHWHSYGQLIVVSNVPSNKVASATAQLVAVSHVTYQSRSI
jgi:hypothetical protein